MVDTSDIPGTIHFDASDVLHFATRTMSALIGTLHGQGLLDRAEFGKRLEEGIQVEGADAATKLILIFARALQELPAPPGAHLRLVD